MVNETIQRYHNMNDKAKNAAPIAKGTSELKMFLLMPINVCVWATSAQNAIESHSKARAAYEVKQERP